MLHDLRVIDFSQGISGAYCSKLLADAWADVVKAEPPAGDPLRRWTASGADLGGEDGALFRYLCASKRSVIAEVGDAPALAANADVLVEDLGPGVIDVAAVRAANPRLVVISVSPFGREGPWAEQPSTEFTLQAWCGSIAGRGTPDRPPVQAGGRIGKWAAAVFAALAGLAAYRRAKRTGLGEHVDVSILEVMSIIFQPYVYLGEEFGTNPTGSRRRTVEIPSIVPTADGFVGFCTVTGQMFQDFLVLIERADLLADEGLARAPSRFDRRDEFLAAVHAWTTQRTTAEVIEQASAMRVPVAPIGDGAIVTGFEHFVHQGVFVPGPHNFLQPRAPYRLGTMEPRPFAPAPSMSDRVRELGWSARAETATTGDDRALPLAGLRIVDFTAFWAGPAATYVLAALGADVVKLESIQRPDGMRFNTANAAADRWWEWGPVFHITNPGKRDVTLDMNSDKGRELARELIKGADVVIENFTPRVMEHFGFGWDAVRAVNPRVVMVRMPAFGLTGPWRDRSGFAQNMEQVSGMASVTGYPDGPPIIPRGPCDPVSGMHAVVAMLCGLEARDRTGEGMLIEVPMVEAVLNIAAEQVVEYGAYGNLLRRDGNRGPGAAPQGVYPCRGDDQWLALAVENDEQWKSLRAVMGDPMWMAATELESEAGRRHAHDLIDREVSAWTQSRDRDETAEALLAEGVPAAPVLHQPAIVDNPQLLARKFFEVLDHPLVGEHRYIGMPFRYATNEQGWLRRPPPTLGQDNDEVLGGELGLDDDELRRLRDDLVIGDRPVGA